MTDLNSEIARIAGWKIVNGCPRQGANHWHEGNLCEGYAPPDFLAPENRYLLEKLAEGKGHKIMTSSRLVDGKRRYWAELDNETAAFSNDSLSEALALAIKEAEK